jgi:release factor glutamine methyltransferase
MGDKSSKPSSETNPELSSQAEQKAGNPTWEKDVREMFLTLKGSPEVREVEIEGVHLKVLPDVFSPEIFFESRWFAERVAVLAQGKRLLEVGPGTGIIGLFAALKGAKVTAVDVNEKAIENTRINFEENGLSVDARLGSVYGPLGSEEQYDVIFWNHPFNKTSQQDTDPFLKSVFDFEYIHLDAYIAEARTHLFPTGKLLLGTSNIADLTEIADIASKYGYDFVLVDKVDTETEVDGSDTDFRIYEFVPRRVANLLG